MNEHKRQGATSPDKGSELASLKRTHSYSYLLHRDCELHPLSTLVALGGPPDRTLGIAAQAPQALSISPAPEHRTPRQVEGIPNQRYLIGNADSLGRGIRPGIHRPAPHVLGREHGQFGAMGWKDTPPMQGGGSGKNRQEGQAVTPALGLHQ